jgi:hypothetical protein
MALKGGDKLEAKLKSMLGQLSKGEGVRVGFLESATYPYSGGPQVAQVAFWNEYGTKTSPARPFFRNMIAANKSGWGEILAKSLKATGNDVPKSLGLLGDRMAFQLSDSIVSLDSPPLSEFTLALRKVRQGHTDAPTSLIDLKEARKLLKENKKALDGVTDKPLIYTNVMRSHIAYQVDDGEEKYPIKDKE